MRSDPENKRKGKRLLVASIGVATVSYLALQGGCTEDVDEIPLVANLLAPPLDASFENLTTADAGRPADAAFDALTVSGNLLPPPTPSGNLLPPPADASADALITSGNLLPPPPPEAGVDAAARDAATDAASDGAVRDTGLPTSGNLLPPPKPPVVLPPPPRRGETD